METRVSGNASGPRDSQVQNHRGLLGLDVALPHLLVNCLLIIGIYNKLWITPRDTSYEGKFAG